MIDLIWPILLGFALAIALQLTPYASLLFLGLPGRYKVWTIVSLSIVFHVMAFMVPCFLTVDRCLQTDPLGTVGAVVGGIAVTIIASQAAYLMVRNFGGIT